MGVKVGIIKNWDSMWIPEDQLLSQCRDGPGVWGDLSFQIGYSPDCDYLLVLNRPRKSIRVDLPRERIWGIIQEPPNEIYRPMHRGQRAFGRVYNQLNDKPPRFRLSHPLIPWFVKRSWSQLANAPVPEKQGNLSCITSRTVFFKGHVQRQGFLERLQSSVPLELFGRGIRSVDDKWDAHAPFRYSIVMENFRNPYYWTEKVADCFLSWTMPIYYGCQRLDQYFPKESFLQIDIRDPDCQHRIHDFIASGAFEKNLDALAEARTRILNKYSFFAYMKAEIEGAQDIRPSGNKRSTLIRAFPPAAIKSWGRVLFRRLSLSLSS
jgi:hypothetical protein